MKKDVIKIMMLLSMLSDTMHSSEQIKDDWFKPVIEYEKRIEQMPVEKKKVCNTLIPFFNTFARATDYDYGVLHHTVNYADKRGLVGTTRDAVSSIGARGLLSLNDQVKAANLQDRDRATTADGLADEYKIVYTSPLFRDPNGLPGQFGSKEDTGCGNLYIFWTLQPTHNKFVADGGFRSRTRTTDQQEQYDKSKIPLKNFLKTMDNNRRKDPDLNEYSLLDKIGINEPEVTFKKIPVEQLMSYYPWTDKRKKNRKPTQMTTRKKEQKSHLAHTFGKALKMANDLPIN